MKIIADVVQVILLSVKMMKCVKDSQLVHLIAFKYSSAQLEKLIVSVGKAINILQYALIIIIA